jgi:hypothetical protein
VDLALRSPDDAEMRRLLDSVAERADFDRVLGERLVPQNRENSDVLKRLTRLVDWASEAKGHRRWMEPAMMFLANGGQGGSQGGEELFACFRRYVNLALDDKRLGEFGFRMMHVARNLETPENLTSAARRALLSGAYTSAERTFATVQMQEDMALAALEHLVLEAGKSGDEQAFPAVFRQRLKNVDPDSEAWIAGMLAAKTVSELPDLSNKQAKSAGWVLGARHDAAMLRAVNLPGRDAWLTAVFRDNTYQLLSGNLHHVIRASLQEAQTAKKLQPRLIALLEASAGPRKSWNKPPDDKNRASDPYAVTRQTGLPLSGAASFILKSLETADAPMQLAVLDILRDARVPVADASTLFNQLGHGWRRQNGPPAKATLAELLGSRRDHPFSLGVWQIARSPNGEPDFIWGLPDLVQSVQAPGNDAWLKSVKENPDAGFLELYQAWSRTRDKTLQRRIVLKAAPDLAKLPAAIRNAVNDALTEKMGAGDLQDLPAQAAARLREKLAAARTQRLSAARREFDNLNTLTSAYRSLRTGALLGRVLADDDAFVAEVLASWRPLAEADGSGNEIEAFMGGLISYSSTDPDLTMRILRLWDSVSKDSPLPMRRSSKWGDLMGTLWGRVGAQALDDPQFWRDAATLSPKLQAQFWLNGPEYAGRGGLATDSGAVTALREAAKGSEVTRAALEWCLQCATVRRDSKAGIDGDAMLGFAQALKDAGLPMEQLATLVCQSYAMLPRMENPGAVMAATPVLLGELRTLPVEHSRWILQAVQSVWEQNTREVRKAAGDHSQAMSAEALYQVETATLLNFAFTRCPQSQSTQYLGNGLTSIVIATGDAALLELWIKFAGKSLVGDLDLIVALLEKDRVAEAVALAPAAGRNFSSFRPYDSRLESLMPKFDSASKPQTFGLMTRLSMLRDAYGTEAPAEPQAVRKTRLAAEFDNIRDKLTTADRAAVCLALGLNGTFVGKPVPVLDEFANEAAAREFGKFLLTGERGSSATAELFIPAVCSRVFADDLSGISLLTDAIAAIPPGPRAQSSAFLSTIYPIHHCLAAYANRHDAKLPDASAQAILAYAKALAGRRNPRHQGIISQYVHLAASDAASLEAGLKSCGLDGLEPIIYNAGGGYSFTLETYQAMMRVALLHPVASEALLESLGPPLNNGTTTGAMLPSLRDPELRARISPAFFLKWNGDLRAVSPEDMEAINLYATERRADFDENQRSSLDELLARLENARLRDFRGRQMHEEPRRR